MGGQGARAAEEDAEAKHEDIERELRHEMAAIGH
jgi:hypothetical protein